MGGEPVSRRQVRACLAAGVSRPRSSTAHTRGPLIRSREDRLALHPVATFPDKLSFERYWYSEELAEARAEASGLFQVPVLPVWYGVVDSGTLEREPVDGSARSGDRRTASGTRVASPRDGRAELLGWYRRALSRHS